MEMNATERERGEGGGGGLESHFCVMVMCSCVSETHNSHPVWLQHDGAPLTSGQWERDASQASLWWRVHAVSRS